ncbi:MAG: hypothetical protein SGI92_04095 [Bryobacteraceae bacterium]|nr:hypothetical protein [Bryobacteraceae bacterium]
MATPAQIAANRQNATKSTGPATETGKQNTAQNAQTHGMTSAKVLVAGEDPEEYEAIRQNLIARMAPQGAWETSLAEVVVVTHWRHRRMLRYEAAFWDFSIGLILDEGAHQGEEACAAETLLSKRASPKIALTLRYINSAQRACTKALETFEEARSSRPAAEPPSPVLIPPAVDQPLGIGFVSQISSAASVGARLPHISDSKHQQQSPQSEFRRPSTAAPDPIRPQQPRPA